MDPLSHWKENRDIKLQGGAPPVISWFITPIKYKYIYHKPKLLELETNLANYGAPPCIASGMSHLLWRL